MADFTSNGTFTIYYYVQSTRTPRYPYGLCGPFATEAAAGVALERIISARPGSEIHLQSGGFVDDCAQMLTRDQDAAQLWLEKLAAV